MKAHNVGIHSSYLASVATPGIYTTSAESTFVGI